MSQVFMPSYDALYELYEYCCTLDNGIGDPPTMFYKDADDAVNYVSEVFKGSGLKDPETGDSINTRSKALAYLGEDEIEVINADWFDQQYRLLELFVTLSNSQ